MRRKNNMISKIICKTSFKMNRLFFLLIVSCIVISEISLIAIYPAINKNGGYLDFLKGIPQNILAAIGMQGNLNNLNEYLNMNFYNLYVYSYGFCCRNVSKTVSKAFR